MQSEQVRRVRESWALASQDADALSDRFYAELFARHPRAAALFAGVEMEAQRRKFLDTMEALVAVAEDPGRLVREAVPSGRRHGGYGVTAADFDDARAILLDTLEATLGERFDARTRDAWRELYQLVTAVMARAAVGSQSSVVGGR